MPNHFLQNRSFSLLAVIAVVLLSLTSCSDSEEPRVRTESDLVGVWTDTPGHYLYIKSDTSIYSLYIEQYEGEEVGILEPDGYAYEPGYNFIVYINRENEPNVYQLMSLSDNEMVWCWVDNLFDEQYDNLSKSEILGKLLMNADKGFTIDMSKTVTYKKVPESEFNSLIDKYGLEI